MTKKEPPVFYPTTVSEWRNWLEKNHLSEQAVWVVFYRKSSPKKSLTWSEAVDVALCFGWIDSKKIKIDEETSHQYFSKRKPVSTWSKINKDKVEVLIEKGLVTPAGFESIETAKQNGSWSLLDEVEALVVPEDLEAAFDNHPGSRGFYEGLSKSAKKGILHWVVLARRPETRAKRIAEVVENATQGLLPRHMQTW